MDNNNIVNPVPGVFTFVGSDGNDLRDLVLKLNDQWSFYMVKRVGDDAQLADLETTIKDIKDHGVDRGSMAAVESLNVMPLHPHYPVSSYTLKRSQTNQHVALEEVGKQILTKVKEIILSVVEWVKKQLSNLAGVFRRASKEAREQQSEKLLTKVNGMPKLSYRSKADLEGDEKVVAHVTAMESYFTQYTEHLLEPSPVLTNFGAVVKNLNPIFDYLDSTAKDLNKLVTYSRSSESEVSEFVKALSVPTLDKFLAIFTKEADLKDRISATMSALRDQSEELVRISPYDFDEWEKRANYLTTLIDPSTSPFIIPDAEIERLEAVVKTVDSALNFNDSVLGKLEEADRKDLVLLWREAGEKLATALDALRMVSSLSIQLYDKSVQALKIIYVHLTNCAEKA